MRPIPPAAMPKRLLATSLAALVPLGCAQPRYPETGTYVLRASCLSSREPKDVSLTLEGSGMRPGEAESFKRFIEKCLELAKFNDPIIELSKWQPNFKVPMQIGEFKTDGRSPQQVALDIREYLLGRVEEDPEFALKQLNGLTVSAIDPNGERENTSFAIQLQEK